MMNEHNESVMTFASDDNNKELDSLDRSATSEIEAPASAFEAGPRILRLLNVVPVDLAELLAEIEAEA